ncbi:LSU ribosomal protein L24p (L26e) [hydrothermal vent metagenome]|uniref:LSU ribosomal protein L24p (L26e) n=1 Tax=hydrothermal vent metagenome TaxID=652676 RepID=A0A1W1BKE7_9ZZZZ
MNKIRKNDEIIVIAGKDKGKKGVVSKVIDCKILVDGINVVKKHVKPNPNAGVTGGIVDKEMPLDISNVALLNPKTNKADKVGIRFDEKGLKERFFKSNGDRVDI